MSTINRYTELPYVLHILQTKTITLLSPNFWDDRNDAHFIECYKTKKQFKTALALCLTEAAQTYHHWKVFTHGASGACIRFKKVEFLEWIAKSELDGKKVVYKTISQLKNTPPSCNELPFLKRNAYQHEKEFRVLYCKKEDDKNIKSFNIPLTVIDSIVINPWLSKDIFESLRKSIIAIDGCAKISILRATIIENETWRNLADDACI